MDLFSLKFVAMLACANVCDLASGWKPARRSVPQTSTKYVTPSTVASFKLALITLNISRIKLGLERLLWTYRAIRNSVAF